MYDKLGYGWGNSLLGFLALSIGVPFPILIFRVTPLINCFAYGSTAQDSDGMDTGGRKIHEKQSFYVRNTDLLTCISCDV